MPEDNKAKFTEEQWNQVREMIESEWAGGDFSPDAIRDLVESQRTQFLNMQLQQAVAKAGIPVQSAAGQAVLREGMNRLKQYQFGSEIGAMPEETGPYAFLEQGGWGEATPPQVRGTAYDEAQERYQKFQNLQSLGLIGEDKDPLSFINEPWNRATVRGKVTEPLEARYPTQKQQSFLQTMAANPQTTADLLYGTLDVGQPAQEALQQQAKGRALTQVDPTEMGTLEGLYPFLSPLVRKPERP